MSETPKRGNSPAPWQGGDRRVLGERIAVGLDGSICIGKSTTTRRMVALRPQHTREIRETVDQGFLTLFYSDVKKYGWSMQYAMLATRLHQWDLVHHFHQCEHPEKHLPRRATSSRYIPLSTPPPDSTGPCLRDSAAEWADQHRTPEAEAGRWEEEEEEGAVPDCLLVWDRTMIGDFAFCLWNHRLGSITDQELAVYEGRFGSNLSEIASHPFWQELSLEVFLCDDPSGCHRRILEERKNPAERLISLEYLDGLDAVHFDILIRLLGDPDFRTPVAVLCFGQYDDPRELRTFFEEAARGSVRLGRVVRLLADEAPPRGDSGSLWIEDDAHALERLPRLEELPSVGNRLLQTPESTRRRLVLPDLSAFLPPSERERHPSEFRHYSRNLRNLVTRWLASGDEVVIVV